MRREFYDHQYGGDEYCVRNKKKLAAVVGVGGPSAEANNIIGINKNNKNSSANNGSDQVESHQALRSQNSSASSNGQESHNNCPGWTKSRTFETQLTTDPETDGDADSEAVTWSAI
jgi:hypothetical protein